MHNTGSKKMRVLLFSCSAFIDCSIPLYNTYRKKDGVEADYLVRLDNLNTPLFTIKQRKPFPGVIKALSYPELIKYEGFADLDGFYFLNTGFPRFRYISSIIAIISLFIFIKRGRYDVIHCDFAFRGWLRCLYLFRKRIVRTQHDPFPHSGEEWSRQTKAIINDALRLIKKTVILNRTQYDDFCVSHGLNPHNVLLNRLGIYNHMSIFDTSSVEEIKDCVLFFGRVSKYKGLENFCEAMVYAHDAMPSLKVIIAGSGYFDFDVDPYRKLSYFKIINKYLDPEELASLIKKASIVSCVYSDATQSGVILTSFALEKPVIASDTDTMKEVVDPGKSGLLVSPANPELLAKAVVEILGDEQLRQEMKKYIHDTYVVGERSWNAIADKYLAFYKS